MKSARPVVVLHVIVGLNVGGAEMMLKRLIEHHQQARFACQHIIISLTGLGTLGEEIQRRGVPVYALHTRGALDLPLRLWQMVGLIRSIKPDVVQTWMYHADLLGGVAARLAGVRNVIWGIRSTLIPQGRWSRTQLVIFCCATLSRWVPRAIVCCAESTRLAHVRLGYAAEKMTVISNGYDLSKLSRMPGQREIVRERLNVADEIVLVGTVGRFDPLKDHENFVMAAAQVALARPQVRFLMVGRGLDSSNAQIAALLAKLDVASRFILLGERSDVADLLSAMDVYCLASRAEGFPNAVAEAMAMHVPCVVTDVGDAALIVQDTGYVVPPRNPTALAAAIQAMVDLPAAERTKLGVRARRIIEGSFSMDSAAQHYGAIYSIQTAGT